MAAQPTKFLDFNGCPIKGYKIYFKAKQQFSQLEKRIQEEGFSPRLQTLAARAYNVASYHFSEYCVHSHYRDHEQVRDRPYLRKDPFYLNEKPFIEHYKPYYYNYEMIKEYDSCISYLMSRVYQIKN
jgi:hypothetical protein